MFKKLILFSTIAVLGGCEAINQAKQCDPDKNYIISNPQAMEEYKKLKSEGKIRIYYHNNQTKKHCNNNNCIAFDTKNYDFIEMYFNDDNRKGIYTITTVPKISGCDLPIKNSNTLCYKILKNVNDVIISDYEWNLSKIDNVMILEFKNIKKDEQLFKFSYQTYSTGSIGGPGGAICPQSYINNPEYKFNPYSFPQNNQIKNN